MRKTPLSGLGAWTIQRLTAVYLLIFFLFLLGYFVFWPPGSYEIWRDWISSTPLVIATSLFFIALLVHAWVGLRDVVLDYVKPLPLRLGVLAVLGFSLIGLAVWAIKVLLTAAA
ncbi:MAG: succinate dehydrogenase, hydrophobic membrane anchor protein [Candidimonas sp.]|nr:succinate dehydrogenase, hydrophobic membrane anchor protein [Candidimonas sp.]